MQIKPAFLFLLLFMPWSLFSQECSFYYPQMEGSELIYQQYDKKEAKNGSSSHKVIQYKQNSDRSEATILFKTYDKNDKPVSESMLEVKCEAGIFYVDMEGYINQQMVSAYEDMEVKVVTDNLELPGNLSPGDVLKEGSVKMEISSSGLRIMTLQLTITDRLVESKENITTPAGTFECFKINQSIVTTRPVGTTMKGTEWLCPGTGMIKSESYNGSGKFIGRSELIELK